MKKIFFAYCVLSLSSWAHALATSYSYQGNQVDGKASQIYCDAPGTYASGPLVCEQDVTVPDFRPGREGRFLQCEEVCEVVCYYTDENGDKGIYIDGDVFNCTPLQEA